MHVNATKSLHLSNPYIAELGASQEASVHIPSITSTASLTAYNIERSRLPAYLTHNLNQIPPIFLTYM